MQGRYLVGGFFILVGIMFLLNQFFDIPALNPWKLFQFFWPAVLILGGSYAIIKNPRQFFVPLAIVLVGLAMLLDDYVDFNIWSLWPVFLIIGGLGMIFGQDKAGKNGRAESEEEYSNESAIFWGVEKSVIGKNYKGGNLTAVFGGIDLDLRKAEFIDGAKINTFVAFGGIELRLPEHVEVISKGVGIFGAYENKTNVPSDEKKIKVIVDGTALFGGVDIKN